jgi:hypothetical protein
VIKFSYIDLEITLWLLIFLHRGFYVNRCSRNFFDPNPAVHPFFAHDLFSSLYGFSNGVKSAWVNLCNAAATALSTSTAPAALDDVASLILLAPDNKITKPANTWILPSASSGNAEDVQAAKRNAHSYDSVRAQESLTDLCGPEELGAAREW